MAFFDKQENEICYAEKEDHPRYQNFCYRAYKIIGESMGKIIWNSILKSKLLVFLYFFNTFIAKSIGNPDEILEGVVIGHMIVEFWGTYILRGLNMIYEYHLKHLVSRKNEREILIRTNEITIMILIYSLVAVIMTLFGVNFIYQIQKNSQLSIQTKSNSFKYVSIAFLGVLIGTFADLYRRLRTNLVKKD